MLELDFAVALALVLCLASTALCVGYGLSHWNADDDADGVPLDETAEAEGSNP